MVIHRKKNEAFAQVCTTRMEKLYWIYHKPLQRLAGYTNSELLMRDCFSAEPKTYEEFSSQMHVGGLIRVINAKFLLPIVKEQSWR